MESFQCSILNLNPDFKSDAIDAFKAGDLPLSQLCKIIELSKLKTLELLGSFNIPIADYSISEDMEIVKYRTNK